MLSFLIISPCWAVKCHSRQTSIFIGEKDGSSMQRWRKRIYQNRNSHEIQKRNWVFWNPRVLSERHTDMSCFWFFVQGLYQLIWLVWGLPGVKKITSQIKLPFGLGCSYLMKYEIQTSKRRFIFKSSVRTTIKASNGIKIGINDLQ